MISIPLSPWFYYHAICPEITEIDTVVANYKKLGYRVELEFRPDDFTKARHVVLFDDNNAAAAAMFKLTHL